MSAHVHDLIVLGGGSGGYACALRAAELGLDVVLVEKDKLGGTCLHRGCVPTKALLHAAEVADAVRESEVFGVNASLHGVDLEKVNAYKTGVVSRLFKGLQGLVSGRDIQVVAGHGRLVEPRVVEVDGTQYAARHLVLACGSYARSLPGLEIDGDRIITSDHAIEITRVPTKVVVLGGGVIGVELASVWRSFGSEVTIIEALDRLVPTEDEECSRALERAFRKRRIACRTGVRFASAEHTDDGVRVHTDDGETYDADLLLVAVGRGPASADLGLEEQGIAMSGGFVSTDERLRTDVDGVFAIGDLVAGPQLAHRGFQQGIFVAEQIAGLEPVPVADHLVPRVTYCDPEVASVGVTEAVAIAEHGADAITTYTYDLGGNAKSQILKTAGFVKLVRLVDGPVIGVHMVGARVGELIAEGQLITGWEAFPDEVASLVHAHPTQSEALGEAHLALAGKPLHAHS